MAEASPLAGLYPDGVKTEVIGDAEVAWSFGSLEEEHACLRNATGLLDFSSLGRISVTGSGAMEFLQSIVARDIGYLFPERCLTGLVLDEEANPLDIVVIYKVQGGYIVETSVGRGATTMAHLQERATAGVTLVDLRAEQASIALEGPFCWQLVGQVFDPQLTGLSFQGVQQTEWEGEKILVSRLGFTGEYGFKFDLSIGAAEKLWARLAETVKPVGYEALEVAMLEVRQPLLHRELGDDGTVMRCGLNWLVELEEEGYVGQEALMAQRDAGPDVLPVTVTVEGSEHVPAGAAVIAGGEQTIGRIAHCVYSPAMRMIVGVARVEAAWAASGLELEVEATEGRRPLKTASSPLFVPLSWKVPIL